MPSLKEKTMDKNKFKSLFACTCLFLSLWGFLALPAAYAGDGDCKTMTFKNNSDEDIFVGVWHGGSKGLPTKTGYPPPEDFPNWRLPKGESRDWCAPQGYSGRIIARTGCNEKGKCVAGDCCKEPDGGATCANNVCTGGNDSGSVAEFTLDNWTKDGNQNLTYSTWYDPSFVDGYNFPVKIEFETKEGAACKTLGCEKLPQCPWNGGELVDGVCLSPYKKYELEHPDFIKQQQYYILAAKCAKSKVGVCGCGNQCSKDNLEVCPNDYNVTPTVNIKSAGCSPLGLKDTNEKGQPKTPTYAHDELARAQVTCASKDDAKGDGCKFLWDDESRKYKDAIQPVCPDAYTWQYDDHSGLQSCSTSAINKIVVTFFRRPEGKHLNSMRLAQANQLTGTVRVSNKADAGYGYSISFSAKKDTDPDGTEDIVKIKAKNGDTVAITDNCGYSGAVRTCTMTYDEKTGLVPVGTVLKDGKFVPNPDDPNEAKKADAKCYGPDSGYNWKEQTPTFLAMGIGDNVCAGGPIFMYVAPNRGLKGNIKVNNGADVKFSGPDAAKFEVKKGAIVVIADNRGDSSDNYSRSCTMKYGEYDVKKTGLIPEGTVFKDGIFIPNPNDPNDAKNARKDCYQIGCSGYRWDRQTTSLPMEAPNSEKCKDEEDTNFTLYPADDAAGSYQINHGEIKTYGTYPKDRKTGFIKISIKDFDVLTLTTGCNVNGKADPEGTKMTCSMIYDAKAGEGGFQEPDDDPPCADRGISNIDWISGSNEKELHFGMPSKINAKDRCTK